MNRVSQICVNYKTKTNLSCSYFTLFLYSGLVWRYSLACYFLDS